MFRSGPITVGAQRWAWDGGRHGEYVGIVGEVKCPIALVKVVGVHGGEGMMGVCGDGFVVRSGVGRGRERIALIVIVVVVVVVILTLLGVVKVRRRGRRIRIVNVLLVLLVLLRMMVMLRAVI